MVVAILVTLGIVIVGIVGAVDKTIIKIIQTNLKRIMTYDILIITDKMLMENHCNNYNIVIVYNSVIMKNCLFRYAYAIY